MYGWIFNCLSGENVASFSIALVVLAGTCAALLKLLGLYSGPTTTRGRNGEDVKTKTPDDEESTTTTTSTMMMTTDEEVEVTGLWIYPIKSCAGTAVRRAEVTARGLAGDRLLMVVDREGNCITQRVEPRLALVLPTFIDGSTSQKLQVKAGGESVVLKIRREGAATRAVLFGEAVDVVDQGDEVAALLERFLGSKWAGARLVAQHAASTRAPRGRQTATTSTSDGDGAIVSLADQLPLQLASEESLAAVAVRADRQDGVSIGLERFRPNVVVRAGAPFAEDAWHRVRIGEHTNLILDQPCGRCKLPTVDQRTGVFDPHNQPTRALREFRCIQKAAFFGQLALPEQHTTEQHTSIAVGDLVTVLHSKQSVVTGSYQ